MLTELSWPIALFYAFEKLADLTVLNTFENVTSTLHGVDSGKKCDSVIVRKRGVFARLHDCHSIDPSIYAENMEFTLENLINAGPIRQDAIMDLMQGTGNPLLTTDEKTGGLC